MNNSDTGLSETNQSRLRRAKRLLQLVAATATNPTTQRTKHGNHARRTDARGLDIEHRVNRMIARIDELLKTEEDFIYGED